MSDQERGGEQSSVAERAPEDIKASIAVFEQLSPNMRNCLVDPKFQRFAMGILYYDAELTMQYQPQLQQLPVYQQDRITILEKLMKEQAREGERKHVVEILSAKELQIIGFQMFNIENMGIVGKYHEIVEDLADEVRLYLSISALNGVEHEHKLQMKPITDQLNQWVPEENRKQIYIYLEQHCRAFDKAHQKAYHWDSEFERIGGLLTVPITEFPNLE